jgi:hypothetical protein
MTDAPTQVPTQAPTDAPAASPRIADDLRPCLMAANCATTPETGADLLFGILAIATQPEPEDDAVPDPAERPGGHVEGHFGERIDPRAADIEDVVRRAAPAVRTRAAQLATALLPIVTRCRSLILAIKSEAEDADVTHGDAEILPDGWLVVTMGGEQVGRVPYNPDRGQEDAARMAEEMLTEHVRLHVMRSTEVVRVPLPTDAREMPPRPDGVRARRLVVQ